MSDESYETYLRETKDVCGSEEFSLARCQVYDSLCQAKRMLDDRGVKWLRPRRARRVYSPELLKVVREKCAEEFK